MGFTTQSTSRREGHQLVDDAGFYPFKTQAMATLALMMLVLTRPILDILQLARVVCNSYALYFMIFIVWYFIVLLFVLYYIFLYCFVLPWWGHCYALSHSDPRSDPNATSRCFKIFKIFQSGVSTKYRTEHAPQSLFWALTSLGWGNFFDNLFCRQPLLGGF